MLVRLIAAERSYALESSWTILPSSRLNVSNLVAAAAAIIAVKNFIIIN